MKSMSESPDLLEWATARLLVGLRKENVSLIQRSAETILILAWKRAPKVGLYIPNDETIRGWEKRGLKLYLQQDTQVGIDSRRLSEILAELDQKEDPIEPPGGPLALVDGHIDAVSKALDKERARPDRRNEVLRPLQELRRRIQSETSVARLKDYLPQIEECFADALAEIE
jgi:hypothetical protein